MPPVPAFVFDAEELARVGSQEALFAAVAEFLHAVAAQRPLMLVLDDLHWSDQASLDFVRFLARQVADQRSCWWPPIGAMNCTGAIPSTISCHSSCVRRVPNDLTWAD